MNPIPNPQDKPSEAASQDIELRLQALEAQAQAAPPDNSNRIHDISLRLDALEKRLSDAVSEMNRQREAITQAASARAVAEVRALIAQQSEVQLQAVGEVLTESLGELRRESKSLAADLRRESLALAELGGNPINEAADILANFFAKFHPTVIR